MGSIGGGSVQNDGYKRLHKFIELEHKGALEVAKQNPQKYDSMLQIDLADFNNSDEFKAYLKTYDQDIDKAEAIFVGWVFVFLSEFSLILVHLIKCLFGYVRRKVFKVDKTEL